MKPSFAVTVFCIAALAICSNVSAQGPRLVCYFPSWAYYRADEGKYGVDNINPSLCTHLVYAFAKLDGASNTIQPYDPNLDINNKFYERLAALKIQNPNLVTMIAIGGDRDSNDGSGKYSKLVSSSANINKFANSVTSFLQQHKFDGLDLDWEYPSTSDKTGFANLLRSLQLAFNTSGYLLSVAVPTSPFKVDQGYDVATMVNTVDFINLMSYDMHGYWNFTHADHHAPLYKRPWDEATDTNNIDDSVNYWLNKGMPPEKINLGIPLYGRTWRLASIESVDHQPPAVSANLNGTPGPFTNQSGFLGYHEICNFLKTDGWETFRDPDGLNPYAVSPIAPKTWVGFDDPASAGIKTDYALEQKLGGTMVWDISTDDFGNLCGTGKNPIMRTISEKMGVITRNPKGRFVCYYPNWSGYRLGPGRFTVNDIDSSLCTDYVYAFTTLDNATFEMKPFDAQVDIVGKGYEKFVQMKAKNPNITTWIAVGGWTDSHHGDKYSQLVSNPININKFVQSVYNFLSTHGFDGLDIDWEFPMSESDRSGFSELLVSLRAAFSTSYKISVAMSVNTMIIDSGYDIETIKEKADFVNLMAYDMHGSWETLTDNHAPLYKRSWEDKDSNNNIDYTVKHLLSHGLPAGMLNLGIPLYGQSWTLESHPTAIKPTLPGKASGSGEPGPFTNERGYLGYNEICKYKKFNNWQETSDPAMLNGPYAFTLADPYTWVGYDDPKMAAHKARYALNRKLGGVMVWDMSTDDFKASCSSQANPILTAIAQALSGTATTPAAQATTLSATSKQTTASSVTTPSNVTNRATVTRFLTATPEPPTRRVRTTPLPNSATVPKTRLVLFAATIGLFLFLYN